MIIAHQTYMYTVHMYVTTLIQYIKMTSNPLISLDIN